MYQQPPLIPVGGLFFTNDPGLMAHAHANGFTIVALLDIDGVEVDSLPRQNCVLMSTLLPPLQILEIYINEQPYLAMEQYAAYLASPDCEEGIVCILAALFKKKLNICLYFDYEADQEFRLIDIVAGFFANSFGIIAGEYMNPNSPPHMIDQPQFRYVIADLLFVNGHFTKEEYAMMIPHNAIPSDRACALISRYINYNFPDMNSCIRACTAFIHDTRKEVETGKIMPVVMVRDHVNAIDEHRKNQSIMNSQTGFG